MPHLLGLKDKLRWPESASNLVQLVPGYFSLNVISADASAFPRDFDQSKVRVAGAGDVESFYQSQEMNEGFRRLLPNDGRKLLLVCMNGSTSLGLARLLAERGVEGESLVGGIAGLSANRGVEASELIELAKQ